MSLAISNASFLMKDAFIIIGYGALFDCGLAWIERGLNRLSARKARKKHRGGKRWSRSRFAAVAGVTFLCWIPYLILVYPASMLWDTTVQLQQAYGYRTMTNDSPFFQTWLMGAFAKLGGSTRNASTGLFLYVVVQSVFAALVLTYMLNALNASGVDGKILKWVWGFYTIFPIVPFYLSAIGKDINFSILILLLSTLIFELSTDPSGFFASRAKPAILLAALLFLPLLRNAGLALLIACVPFLLLAARRYWRRALAIGALAVAFALLWVYVFLPVNGIKGERVTANLSIPLQQTARYVKEYGEEVTEREREIIDQVLEYDKLAESYNPELSDDVKLLFRTDATGAQIRDYIGVYMEQFAKHPLCYVDALLNKCYGYFFPNDKGRERSYIFVGMETNVKELNEQGFNLAPRYPNAVSKAAFIMKYFRNLPLIGTMASIGFYVWGCIIALYMCARRGSKRSLLSFVPAGFVILGCVASPVNAYFRYSLPVVFCMPFLCAVTVYNWTQFAGHGRRDARAKRGARKASEEAALSDAGSSEQAEP